MVMGNRCRVLLCILVLMAPGITVLGTTAKLWWLQRESPPSHSNLAVNCTGVAGNARKSKHCTPAVCMEVWVSHMPQTWLDTTDGGKEGLRAPLWSPTAHIVCSVALAERVEEHCSCELPLPTSKNVLQEAESTRVILVGDSTVRNFDTFYKKHLQRNSYAALSGDNDYSLALEAHLKQYSIDGMRGDTLQNYTSAMNSFAPRLPNPKTKWKTSEFADTPCLLSSEKNASSHWIRGSYEVLSDYADSYFDFAKAECARHEERLLIFVVTAGLHYMPRFPFAPPARTYQYELDIINTFHSLLRGVHSHKGCSSRAVFMWRTPNIIDDSKSNFHDPPRQVRYAQCMSQALNETAEPLVSAELDHICQHMTFDSTSSQIMAQKGARVVSLLNLCLSHRGSLGGKNGIDSRDREPVLGLGQLSLDALCPPDIEGAFVGVAGASGHAVPGKILSFPSSGISQFLIKANYASDGRHYGAAMYVPFMRSLQGVAHEFILSSPPLTKIALDDKAWAIKIQKCRMFQMRTPMN